MSTAIKLTAVICYLIQKMHVVDTMPYFHDIVLHWPLCNCRLPGRMCLPGSRQSQG